MSDEIGRIDGARIWQNRFLDAHLDRVRYPNGTVGEQVLMIHQYRYATGGKLWEIPAGRLEPGEAPLTCAHRELLEETGCTAAVMSPLTTMWTTPGFTDEKIHIFMATGLTLGQSAHEADEFIEVVALPLADVLRKVESGEISDAKTIIGLLYAAGFRT